jgi:hypothetical protein
MISPQIDVGGNPQLTELVQQTDEQTIIGLTLHGEAEAVLLSAATFRALLNRQDAASAELSSWEELAQQCQDAIVETGYNSREKILELVQTVKRELATERDIRLSNRDNRAS